MVTGVIMIPLFLRRWPLTCPMTTVEPIPYPLGREANAIPEGWGSALPWGVLKVYRLSAAGAH